MKQCQVCYKQIADTIEVCPACGSDFFEPIQKSAKKRLSCPWCLSICNYAALYTNGAGYRCPHCTKAFTVRNGKTSRSDGTSPAAKALALIFLLLVGIPLLFLILG